MSASDARREIALNILVVGGGGREHAICWALSDSPRVDSLVCVPGNAGIASVAKLAPGNPEDGDEIVGIASRMRADLVVIGPEAPLVAGVADTLRSHGIRVVGHSRVAAMLEGSKIVAKEFMDRNGIPTARFAVCDSPEAARAAVREGGLGFPVVVKADGLAAGKGVRIAETVEDADEAIEAFMVRRELGVAGARVVLEEALVGREASFIYFTDGTRLVAMPPAQDHKRIGDGDTGPNTGGMGTFSLPGLVDGATSTRVYEEIAEPTVRRMREEGTPLSGILFVGVMLTADGPMVLEYNVRFGDPETQSVLKRLDSDLVDVFDAIGDGSLERVEVAWSDDAALCLVLASEGYPAKFAKGKVIRGLDVAAAVEGVTVFHAGTRVLDDGSVVTAGGRVLGVTARAATLEEARARAYAAADAIAFDGKTFRTDIGRR